MSQKTSDAAPFIQALSFAFYALHARLIENGALQHGEVSDVMRALDPGPNPDARMTAAILSAMADNLDAHTFGPAGTARSFGVIDGGKQD